MEKKKLVLIDGNSIAYRAFFALPLLNNDKGVHTNAVYGFTMMLNKIMEDEKPTHILVAFDAGKTTFRHATFGEYKGGSRKHLLNYRNNSLLFVIFLTHMVSSDMS
jgi:DNA polymerase-1